MDELEVVAQIKAENEQRIRAQWGVEIPSTLPMIEPASDVKMRSAQEVAARAAALCYVSAYGHGAPASVVHRDLERYGLWPSVSTEEAQILRAPEPTPQQRVDLTWLTEAIQELAWTLQLVEVDHRKDCEDSLAERVRFRSDPADFIRDARLRPVAEIQRECDLLYRLHWYTRECRLWRRPCEFSEELIWERRRAIDWVYGVDVDWDEIAGDT